MSDLERYLDRVIEHRPSESPLGTHRQEAAFPTVPGQGGAGAGPEAPSPNPLAGILRRWYLALGVFVLLAAIGIPAVWFFVEPGYVVTGYVRVAPALQDVLKGTPDAGSIGNYEQFVNTQAMSITSPAVLERVVDEMAGKNLSFFTGSTIGGKMAEDLRARLRAMFGSMGPMDRLKRAVASGVIAVQAIRGTELIAVSMKSMKPQEASKIVDSLVRNYMAIYAYGATKEEEANLRLLENSRKELQDKLQQKNQRIRQRAQEYGGTSLDSRQDVMVQRVSALLGEVTRLESSRISLETSLQVPDPQDVSLQAGQLTDPNAFGLAPMLAARNQYINSDPMVQELTRRIVTLEQELILVKQSLAPENPTIKQKEDLISTFRSRLDTKHDEVGQEFDKIMSEQRKVASQQQKAASEQMAKAQQGKVQERRVEMQMAIERIKAHEARLKQILADEDTQAKQMGQASIDIQDLKFQMDLDKEMYDTVCRRIKEVEMQGKRDPRITVHALADVERYEDKRPQYSAAAAFGALGIGCLVAFLRDKADKRIRTPDEVAQRLRLPIIGTITDSKVRRPVLLEEQLAEDYQTIRTNLGLFGNGGVPRRLAVASPGTQEGKTTFAINLAISLARSGKRVLLIDGDLRKPDVAGLLGIASVAKGAPAVMAEDGFAFSLSATSLTGLDVLVPLGLGKTDPYEIVISPEVAQRINLLSQNYDHLIIDTPPVLAFPDALIWARISGFVVLASFMGRTTAPDLTEAQMRLSKTHAQILGAVMNNVGQDRTYNRYRYGYGYGTSAQSGRRARHARRRLMASVDSVAKKEDGSRA